MKRYLIITATLLLTIAGSGYAQKAAIKTNALYWATATPNLGVEFALGERWTVEVAGGYNPWTFDKDENLKAKHYLISPEVRYWFCESFNGHFLGINGNYTRFNISGMPIPGMFYDLTDKEFGPKNLDDARIDGWAAGAGITYGYQFLMSSRWNLELTLGLGWWYTEYDQFESRKCGMFQQAVGKHAIGLTSLGVSFIYLIK